MKSEESINQNPALMDEITVRPAKSQVHEGSSLADEISVRSVKNQVENHVALMDEINVRPAENPAIVNQTLSDQISVRSVENHVIQNFTALMDGIYIKPCPGPLNIEYELLDDLITKGANYRKKNAKPSGDVTRNDDHQNDWVEVIEPDKTVSINDIAEIVNKAILKQDTIPAARLQSDRFNARGKETNHPLREAKHRDTKVRSQGILANVLASLMIYNNVAFYIQDTDLSRVEILEQIPQIKGFTFKKLNTASELKEMIDNGCDMVIDVDKIKRGLKKGMVAFLSVSDRELASISWACMTKRSKEVFRGYPYYEDLDKHVCIVGSWTNPKFQNRGISSYVEYERRQLLKEKGFKVERSIVEASSLKDSPSMKNCRRRRSISISILGVFGFQYWKEHTLNNADVKRPYRLITLLFLATASPGRLAKNSIC